VSAGPSRDDSLRGTVIPKALLRTVLAVEVIVTLACLGEVALHSLLLWWRIRADAPRLTRGRAALTEAVLGHSDVDNDRVADLTRLPRRVQVQVVDQLAVSLTGEDGRRVAEVADRLGLVAAAKRRCRSRLWWRRLLGAHQLNVHGGGEVVLPGLFDDADPAVRAQAIEWAGDARRADLAPRLVQALRDPSALCRHTAADSILRAGASLVDALAAELSSCTGRQQADLLAILARRPDGRYSAAALAALADDLPELRAAAAGLLGGVGGAEGGVALRSLLADADETVRATAADALRRLGLEEAVPDLVPLLRDPSFAVRRAAGTALAGLGPGGTLLLRHYLNDPDADAAAMARHCLDVAAVRDLTVAPD
jgi:HEAT repeat protein